MNETINGQKIAYIRVSTVDQNEARQVEALSKYQIDKTFLEKISGKNISDRPKLNEMLDYIREGDTIYVHDFSRLARSTKDLLDIIDICDRKKAHLVSTKENLDTSTPQGRLMVTMLGAIYEFERSNILERQKEGIAIAKREGRYKGGQPKKIDRQLFDNLLFKYNHRQINKSQFAIQLGVSRPTLDKLLKKEKEENVQNTIAL